MAEKITLVVRFRIAEPVKEEFLAKLREVFTHIVKEETFVEASLVQDMRDPESILNYEVWNESPESFMKNQMTKAYRADFEKMIVGAQIAHASLVFDDRRLAENARTLSPDRPTNEKGRTDSLIREFFPQTNLYRRGCR